MRPPAAAKGSSVVAGLILERTLRVLFSERAREHVADFKAKAQASPDGLHAKPWAALRRLIEDVIGDSESERALVPKNGLRDALRGIRRDKLGRWRVFYVVSTAHGTAVVLNIGWRKNGDRNDAYAEMERHLSSGEFDLIFESLGMPARGRR